MSGTSTAAGRNSELGGVQPGLRSWSPRVACLRAAASDGSAAPPKPRLPGSPRRAKREITRSRVIGLAISTSTVNPTSPGRVRRAGRTYPYSIPRTGWSPQSAPPYRALRGRRTPSARGAPQGRRVPEYKAPARRSQPSRRAADCPVRRSQCRPDWCGRSAVARGLHNGRSAPPQGRDVIDFDAAALRGGDEPIAVPLTAQNGGKEFDERRPSDRRSAIEPCTISGDPHVEIAAIDRRPVAAGDGADR